MSPSFKNDTCRCRNLNLRIGTEGVSDLLLIPADIHSLQITNYASMSANLCYFVISCSDVIIYIWCIRMCSYSFYTPNCLLQTCGSPRDIVNGEWRHHAFCLAINTPSPVLTFQFISLFPYRVRWILVGSCYSPPCQTNHYKIGHVVLVGLNNLSCVII